MAENKHDSFEIELLTYIENSLKVRDWLSRHVYYYVRIENRGFQRDDVKEEYPRGKCQLWGKWLVTLLLS